MIDLDEMVSRYPMEPRHTGESNNELRARLLVAIREDIVLMESHPLAAYLNDLYAGAF